MDTDACGAAAFRTARYAYTNRSLGPYLYNKDGLPASPFTTEITYDTP